VQITRTTPSRWITLHLSHIFLTDALTFIKPSFHHRPLRRPLPLFQQLYDPAARPVMRGKLHSHSISRPQSFEIPDARAGRVRNHQIFVP
jgi:hypothetical protein